jgi:guanine deaminase
VKLYRGRIFSPVADPFDAERIETTYRYLDNGCLAVGDDGRIVALDEWSAVQPSEGDEVIDLGRSSLITPGLIDTHLHAPQLEMIGSYGGDLLEWLNRYTFPTEAKFADSDHARQIARELFVELPRSGTTSALIFSTIHTDATNIFFEEAERTRGPRDHRKDPDGSKCTVEPSGARRGGDRRKP